jgi:uncharacterized protein (TIGR03382 family)
MWSRVGLSLLVLVCCACEEVELRDDLADEGMSVAYVPGAETIVRVRANLAGNADSWQMSSTNPGVFQVNGNPDFCLFACSSTSADLRAVAPGTAELEVRAASGRLITTATIEVAIPDAARLIPGEDLLLDEDEAFDVAERVVGVVRVVEGGRAVFAVELTRAGDTVAGVGEVVARTDDGVIDAVVLGSTRLPGKPWVEVSGDALGRGTLALDVVDERFARFDVEVIGADEVAAVEIVDVAPGVVGARVLDARGRRVFGVEPDWSVDGLRVGEGHIVPLAAEAGERTLRVCHGDVCDELELAGFTPTTAGDGNELPPAPVSSCAQASGSAPVLALAILVLALVSRRRR